MLPPHKAVPVINSQFGFLAIDRHHHIMASLMAKATTVPIQVVHHHPAKTLEELWHWATTQGLAYPFNPGGSPAPLPTSFFDLKDDPLRYFIAGTAARYKKGQLYPAKLSKTPLWFKVSNSEPFIEFKLADHLYRQGFKYSYDMDDIEELVKKAKKLIGKYFPQVKG